MNGRQLLAFAALLALTCVALVLVSRVDMVVDLNPVHCYEVGGVWSIGWCLNGQPQP